MYLFQLLFAVAVVNPEALAGEMRRAGAANVEIRMVQLDRDPSLEAVVRYELADSGVHAVVLDPHGGEWQVAGRFNSWWEYTKADGERFLEFRETVETGVLDVLVRTRSGGTEESRTTLDVWRLRDGVMRNVLSVLEQEAKMVHPSGDVLVAAARLKFGPGRITVEVVHSPGNRMSCEMFNWSGERFQFVGASCH